MLYNTIYGWPKPILSLCHASSAQPQEVHCTEGEKGHKRLSEPLVVKGEPWEARKWPWAAPHHSTPTAAELWWHMEDTSRHCCPTPPSDHPTPWESGVRETPPNSHNFKCYETGLKRKILLDMLPLSLSLRGIPFSKSNCTMTFTPLKPEFSPFSWSGVGAGRTTVVPVPETTNSAAATFLPSLWDLLSTVSQHRQLASKNGNK